MHTAAGPGDDQVRPYTLDKANGERSRAAAAEACAALQRIVARGGRRLPSSLAEAGKLRLAHPTATLAELAEMTDPPVSKDAFAARLRRLLARDPAKGCVG